MKKLKTTRTVTLKEDHNPTYGTNLEEEVSKVLTEEITEEIDWEILSEMLVSGGWTKVAISEQWSNMTALHQHEIKEWCREHLTGHYKARGRMWVFEKEQDAEWFILRWS